MNAKTKDFKATSFSMPGPINLSDEPAKSAGRRFASDRDWKKIGPNGVSPDAQSAVVTKPNLPMLPRGGTKSHPNLDVKSEASKSPVGNGSVIGAPKSGEKNLSAAVKNQMPTKWFKKGYSKDTPSTLPSGGRLARKWEL